MTSSESILAQDVYRFMDERNIFMSFVGDLTHQVTSTLLINIKKSINSLDAATAIKKKIYNITVECLDNITRHNINSDLSGKIPPTIFIFSGDVEHYKIITGNHIHNADISVLTQRIEKANSLDKKGLQDLYRKKMLEKNTFGGLGIIDIALKSGSKLSYEFKPVSENVSFFIFQTIVKK